MVIRFVDAGQNLHIQGLDDEEEIYMIVHQVVQLVHCMLNQIANIVCTPSMEARL